jgi:acyl-coenzyme A thioesterase PaaI-like protein
LHSVFGEGVTRIATEDFAAPPSGGPGYERLVWHLRELIDAVTATDASDPDVTTATDHITAATRQLSRRVPDGVPFPAGHRHDLPGRGHPMLVPFYVDSLSADALRGRVQFTAAYMGHHGVAHGGFIALLFDETLGVFAAQLDPAARTVSLTITYRTGTPVDVDLQVETHLVSHDGRKVRVQGVLRHGDTVTAEGEGLFVLPLKAPGHSEPQRTCVDGFWRRGSNRKQRGRH